MSNFNYTPTKWVAGETVGTATIMNNMEAGISQANESSNKLGVDVSNLIDGVNTIGSDLDSLISVLNNNNISNNGYYKLPGGLIIQWGVLDVELNPSSQMSKVLNVIYPIPFSSIPFCYQGTCGSFFGSDIPSNAGSWKLNVAMIPDSLSSFDIEIGSVTGENIGGNVKCSWFALGM